MNSTANVAADRIERVRARLAELGLDGMLITHLQNIRYLTGFTGSNAWLLLGASDLVFATDGRYEQQATEELDDESGYEVLISRNGILDDVAKRASASFGRGRLGFEGRYLSFAEWERLREPGALIEWVALSDVVEGLRAVKDADEIAAVEKAAKIAATALQDTLGMVEPGVCEAEVASALDHQMRELGADGPAFDTIVASGPRSALPHASTGTRTIREGDLLLCDFGARWRGYCSDLTRTFVLGKPVERQLEVYEAVLQAHNAACDALREGESVATVDRAAREVLESRDLGGKFPHSTGHGVGLEVHESPRLHARGDELLRSNMVVTVEPGLYFAGWGGVRIEDDLVVTGGQPGLLVELSKDRLQSLPL